MISKEEFISQIRRTDSTVTGHEPEYDNFEAAALVAEILKANMPGIGFASISQRINCFLAVCRQLDGLIQRDEVGLGDTHLIISILRLSDKRFMKAAAMFDMRAPRMQALERSELPRSAREYLAGLEMFG